MWPIGCGGGRGPCWGAAGADAAPQARGMGRGSSVILVVLGLLLIAPAAMVLLSSVGVTAYSFLLMKVMLILMRVCGLAVLAWGLRGRLRKPV